MTDERNYTPLVRAIAERHGVNLAEVTGTGVGDRVTKADVHAAALKDNVSASAAGRAREAGISVAELLGLQGSGRDGRIQDLDVLALATAKEYANEGRPLDFTAIEGSGPNGAVRASDVHEAVRTGSAGLAVPRDAWTPAAVQRSRHSEVVEIRSAFSNATVSVDQFALNPLADDARQAAPPIFARASAEAPMPTLFAAGDLPVYLASGADPSVLLNLPWQARHTGARCSPAELAGLMELCAGDGGWVTAEMSYAGEAGNQEYRHRFSAWLSGTNVERDYDGQPKDPKIRAAVAQAEKKHGSVYDMLFGESDRRKAQAIADAAADREAKAKFEREQTERARARQNRR